MRQTCGGGDADPKDQETTRRVPGQPDHKAKQQTDAGDFHRIVLGIAVMSLYVVIINRVFWRPLYQFAERKFRLG